MSMFVISSMHGHIDKLDVSVKRVDNVIILVLSSF